MGVSIQKRFFQVKQAAGLGPAVYPSVLRARGYSVSGGSPRIRSLAISSLVGPVSLTVSLATYLITTSGAKSDKRINGVAREQKVQIASKKKGFLSYSRTKAMRAQVASFIRSSEYGQADKDCSGVER